MKRLADIVMDCLPGLYDPKEALAKLFSHTYIPEQDHDKDFLVIIRDYYKEHEKRVFFLLDDLQERKEIQDQPFARVLGRALHQLGCEYDALPNMFEAGIKVYENIEPSIPFSSSTPQDRWRRDFYFHFTGVSPNSLIALWGIQHEAKLSDSEKTYLIESISNWPMMDKSDLRCAIIYNKYSAIAAELFWQNGPREERREAAYNAAHNSGESLAPYELALHDLDHQFLTCWDARLNPKIS